MKVTELSLSGLKKIELDVFEDERGFFVERFNLNRFRDFGLPTEFVQENHSRSAPHVLRGMHFQSDPHAQGKLVGVTSGSVFDVAIDLRLDSKTFGKWFGLTLNAKDGVLLWIPKGFAHGFCVLGNEPADFIYLVDAPYHQASDTGIRWNDPTLSIQWPISQPHLSIKDQRLPSLKDHPAFNRRF